MCIRDRDSTESSPGTLGVRRRVRERRTVSSVEISKYAGPHEVTESRVGVADGIAYRDVSPKYVFETDD
eukprot:3266027-Rhodomonas_salina.1